MNYDLLSKEEILNFDVSVIDNLDDLKSFLDAIEEFDDCYEDSGLIEQMDNIADAIEELERQIESEEAEINFHRFN